MTNRGNSTKSYKNIFRVLHCGKQVEAAKKKADEIKKN